MKNYRFVVPIALAALMVLSWYMLFDTYSTKNKEYSEKVELARQHVSVGLITIAGSEYSEALEMYPNYDLTLEVAKMYESQGQPYKVDYIKFCEDSIEIYPDGIELYERLLKSYVEAEDYLSGFELLEKIYKRGLKSDFIKNTFETIRYKYREDYSSYTDIGGFCFGYCPIKNSDDEWGYLDTDNDIAISYQFKEAGSFNGNNISPVSDDKGKAFFINTDGMKVDSTKEKYAEFGSDFDDVLWAKTPDGKYVILDLNKNRINNSTFDYISNFNNGIAAAKKDSRWFFINSKGEKAFDGEYQDIKLDDIKLPFVSERAFVKVQSGNYIMIDKSGKQVGNDSYEDCYLFEESNGYATVKIDGKWYFIDSSGNKKSSKSYDGAKPYSNGLAAVCKNGRWGFIDQNEKMVIEPLFDDAKFFTDNGLCFVKKSDTWSTIEVYSMKYELFDK